ncbi:MAG: glycosyl transferase family 2 [Verrucomicrobiales bacterium]|nr:glycosyl transferase family 2 [Verrucomicrobiales bacterium]
MPPAPDTHRLVLIPTYNTGLRVLEVVRGVLEQWAPVWVVVDGSDDGTGAMLDELARTEPRLRVIHHDRNCGKGAAICTGAKAALEAGFTHALAFDADGQHPADFIPRYMALSQAHPEALILGKPVFPENAPRERILGRKVANFWTDFHSGWWGIGDVMFGMRVFPLRDLLAVMNSTRFGRRYDFECESGIRLCWRRVPLINVPTPVRYLNAAEGGVSHYHYLRDNVRLVSLFLRLMPGGILRWPGLIAGRLSGKSLPAE